MNGNTGVIRVPRRGSGALALLACCLAWAGTAIAQQSIGTVTLMAGAPRMVGQTIRPLQAVLSGSVLETGEADAAGVLVQDIALQIGGNSQVEILEEPDRLLIRLTRGFVVFYTEPDTARPVVVETPFGRLSAGPGTAAESESGWYSVRHDPEQAAVSPAVSTFATIEGLAEVEGTAPKAGPHALAAGRQWRIVEGQVPGPPEAGNNRAAAEGLRDMLHRRATELIRSEVSNVDRLAARAGGELAPARIAPAETQTPVRQQLISNNDAIQNQASLGPPQPIPPIVPVEEVQGGFAIDAPRVVAVGAPLTTVAQFVSYDGVPADPNWNDFLTSVNGNPAFQPAYIDSFDNAGFSYIQLAGADAQVITEGGETFLATDVDNPTGWAIFTPQQAVANAGFDQNAQLLDVVTEGFRAIARGEHAGGGRIDPVGGASGFAVVQDGNIQLNPDAPAGYPLLDQAADVSGLTVDGQVASDQIAALGAGRNPQQLSEAGPQLVFLSNSDTDAFGNRFNFAGDELRPTDLDLPGDRQIDASGTVTQPAQAVPLAANENNTVGIQFAGTGEVLAVIHHTGLRAPADARLPSSEHFEVMRGQSDSTVQWRDGGRVEGADGQLLELENLNENPELRNELFAVVCDEVNQLVPAEAHTVCGPALADPGAGIGRNLRLRPGTLARVGNVINRRNVVLQRHLTVPARGSKLRVLKPAGGQLLRQTSTTLNRRHVGRVRAR
jgi:ferric-dicitrate binding protein FerR (iron transport regulator)